MWIIASIVIAMVLLVMSGCYVRRFKTMARPRGLGMSEGLAIGVLASAAVCIALVEQGGYRAAADYLLPCGIAAGGVMGALIERRYQRQRGC